jgi:hypothetical protein
MKQQDFGTTNIKSEQLAFQDCFNNAERFEKEGKYGEAVDWCARIIAAKGIKFSDIHEGYYSAYFKLGNLYMSLYNKLTIDPNYLKEEITNLTQSKFPFDNLTPEQFLKSMYVKYASNNYYLASTQCRYMIDDAIIGLNLKLVGSEVKENTVKIMYNCIARLIETTILIVKNHKILSELGTQENKNNLQYVIKNLQESMSTLSGRIEEIERYVKEVEKYSSNKNHELLGQKDYLQAFINEISNNAEIILSGFDSQDIITN